jgi:putative transposase
MISLSENMKFELKNKGKYYLKHDRHTVSLLSKYIVINPKFRAKVLVGEIAVECEQIIRKICSELGCTIIKMSVAPDHVNMFLRYPPKCSMSFITKRIKGVSSKYLRDKFPELKAWCPKHQWAPGAFHGSVGHGFLVVEKYIKNQGDYEWRQTGYNKYSNPVHP